MKRLVIVGFCAMLISNAALSQPELVKDLSSAPAGIFGNNPHATSEKFIQVNNLLYFPVTDQKGNELWRTDGTEEGTFQVIDVNKGSPDSYVMSIALDETLYFITKPAPGDLYYKLWKTQGTEATTEFLKNITVGNAPADVRDLWVVKGKIVVVAAKGSKVVFLIEDNEIVATDDDDVSFTTSVDLLTGSRAYVLERFDGFTYESEVWTTDGTEAGTAKILTYSEVVTNLATVAGTNYLLFSNSVNDVMRISIPSGEMAPIRIFGAETVNRIFSASLRNYIAASDGLWVTEGNGATLLLDAIEINQVYSTPGKDYFMGYDMSDEKYRAYETDGTVGGTKILSQTRDGFETPYFASTQQIGVIAGKVIVPVTTPQAGMEIASVADGESSIITDINHGAVGSDAHMFQNFNDKIYFAANDGVDGMEIWVTDGTAEGTALLKNAVEGTANGVTEKDLYLLNNEIYFSAYSTGTTQNVWRTKDHGANVEEFFFTNSGNILGTANDSIYMITNPMMVYKSSGNEEPILVADLSSDFGEAMHPSANFSLGDKFIYNLISFGAHPYGQEFWTIDWRAPGTDVLKNIGPGLSDGVFGENYGEEDDRVFVISATKAIFAADDGTNGIELWITDGTAGGTTILKDINPGAGSSGPRKISAQLNNLTFFSANDGVHGDELWSTDGTAMNTKLVADVNPDGDAGITNIITLNGAVYFTGFDGSGYWLFKTTGGAATKIVELTGTSDGIISSGSKLFFADDKGLMISDGTVEGSQNVNLSSAAPPTNFYSFGDQVYFSVAGQLWHSNGTKEATRLVADLEPIKFKQSGDLLFMTANSPAYGMELFKMTQQKFTQDVLFPEIANKTFGDADSSLDVESSSLLPITYTIEGNVEISDNTLHLKGPGPVTITAHQPGDDTFLPAEDVTRSFCVNPAKPTITTTSSGFISSSSEGNQWFSNGVAIEGEIGQTLEVEEGNYSVQVTIDGCVSEMSSVVVLVGLGDESPDVLIYPNPVAERLFVTRPGEVKILDSNGRQLFNGSVQSAIDVSGYASGLYIAIIDNAHFIRFKKK